jgi:hypothetical protein
MSAIFPNGSYTLSDSTNGNGGFSFYAPCPQNVDLTTDKEVTFGCSAMFEQGFQFDMGGKLPGLCECSPRLFVIGAYDSQDSGDNEQVATTSSGGRHDEGCWSAR